MKQILILIYAIAINGCMNPKEMQQRIENLQASEADLQKKVTEQTKVIESLIAKMKEVDKLSQNITSIVTILESQKKSVETLDMRLKSLEATSLKKKKWGR